MVIKGKVDKSAFQDAFKARNMDANTDVQKFLDQMVGDNQGWVILFLFMIKDEFITSSFTV